MTRLPWLDPTLQTLDEHTLRTINTWSNVGQLVALIFIAVALVIVLIDNGRLRKQRDGLARNAAQRIIDDVTRGEE